MSVPLNPQASRLDRILLHLGVLTNKVDDLKPGIARIDDKEAALAGRVRDLELTLEGMKAGNKSTSTVWVFVFHAANTLAILAFTIANFVKGH